MSDGPKPCAHRDCQHDEASHFTRTYFDWTSRETVTVTEGCLARGCDCLMFEAETPKTCRSGT